MQNIWRQLSTLGEVKQCIGEIGYTLIRLSLGRGPNLILDVSVTQGLHKSSTAMRPIMQIS